jgi:hypothetical protein
VQQAGQQHPEPLPQQKATEQQQQQQGGQQAAPSAVSAEQQAVRAALAQHAAAQRAAAAAYAGPLPAAPPKVALLFLCRGNMPLEAVWREFFAAAAQVGGGAALGWVASGPGAAALEGGPEAAWLAPKGRPVHSPTLYLETMPSPHNKKRGAVQACLVPMAAPFDMLAGKSPLPPRPAD